MKLLLASLLAAMSLCAADATGTWTGTLIVPAPDAAERKSPARLVLKQDGSKLTGTAGPNEERSWPIENGKVADGVLTFETANGPRTMRFRLKQTEDEISGEVTLDGEDKPAKLAVKREK